ncbi:MAG: pteridine reductase [Pseudomonadales bacterium]|nr:pteridine reductase [Pseudomonadales bacterium]
MTNVENKVVLITGGAQRIGAEIAKTFHHAGFNIVVHYRHSETQALLLVDELNHQRADSAIGFQADLNKLEEVEKLAEDAHLAWGQLDCLINNASSFYATELNTCTELQWDDLINANVKGAFFLSQALIPSLKIQQGNIINIVDIHSDRPLKNHPIYSIAKAGLAMMTKSLAKELGPDIRVNGISPGAILWPEQDDFGEQQQQEILDRISLSRTGTPEDIANTALFLARQAPYITGQIIAVDGGRTLNN